MDHQVQDKDIIILYSDGVYNNIKDEAITNLVTKNLNQDDLKDPVKCSEEIVEYAMNYAYDLVRPKLTENV